MTEGRTIPYGTLVVIAVVALIFFVLAIAEVMASHAQGRPVFQEPAWAGHLRTVDAALSRRDLGAAERAWREAYVAALSSRSWEGMIEVGDAYLRLGRADGRLSGYQSRARQHYLEALFRARGQRSLDGILRSAEAFAALGDQGVVQQCLRVAEQVAGADPVAVARVHSFVAQVADPSFAAGAARLEPF